MPYIDGRPLYYDAQLDMWVDDAKEDKNEPELDTLGPCGCVDYHYADCPTRQPYIPLEPDDDAWLEDYYDSRNGDE